MQARLLSEGKLHRQRRRQYQDDNHLVCTMLKTVLNLGILNWGLYSAFLFSENNSKIGICHIFRVALGCFHSIAKLYITQKILIYSGRKSQNIVQTAGDRFASILFEI